MWQRLLEIKAQLLSHQGIRRYGANTAWLMGEKILRMFMGLFVGIWVARYLGPDQFGLLSYAQSFVFLFTAIATLGLDSIVVRELVKDDSQRQVLLGTSFTLKLIGSLCILPLLWVGVQFTSNDSYTNLLIFIIASGTIFQSFNVIDFYYQSTVMSKYVAFANTISLVVSSIIKIVLIFNHASLLAFALVGVFDAMILALGFIYFYTQKTQHSLKHWRFDGGLAKRLLKDSWPLIFGSIAASLYMNIDQIMLREMSSNENVGYYAVAVKLSTIWIFITTAIVSSLFPYFTKIFYTDRDVFNQDLRNLYGVMIKISFVIALFVFIFSNIIIESLYGNSYLPSSSVLKLYVWSSMLVFLSNISWIYYINQGLSKVASCRLVIGAIVNIFLNIYLIPLYSIQGAAIATIFSYFISSYLINFLFSSTRENFWLQTHAFRDFFIIRTWRLSYYLRESHAAK